MAAAKNVTAILATGSKYTLDAPIYADPRDVDEIPNIEILPMPYRFHSSMDDGKPDGLPRDLRKGSFDKSKGYFTVRLITRRQHPVLDLLTLLLAVQPIVLLVRPKSTGVIRLKSSDPRQLPECDPRFRESLFANTRRMRPLIILTTSCPSCVPVSEASDVDILVHGMKLAKAVVEQMARDGYAVKPHGKNNPFFDKSGSELSVSDAELGAYARKWATNACESLARACSSAFDHRLTDRSFVQTI